MARAMRPSGVASAAVISAANARASPVVVVDSSGAPHPSTPMCRTGSPLNSLTVAVIACCSGRSEEHTSELQSRGHLVCRLLLEKKKKQKTHRHNDNESY